MNKTWIQKGTDAAKDITAEWGLHLEAMPFKVFPDSKDVFKRDWADQNGDAEYLPSTAVFKAYDMDLSFAYVGGKSTAGAKIVQMCRYIAGTEFSIYSEHLNVGVRCRYISWNEKAFYRSDRDIVEFSIKVKVNNPLSYAAKTNESSEVRLAVSSKTAAYWSDGTATLHDNGATISKVILGGGFGIIAPYSSGITVTAQSVDPTPSRNGYTFTPSLSGDGVLSFSNDGGLTNPAPIALNPHSHSNKSILDNITQLLINAWNAASSWVINTGAPHIADASIHTSALDRSKWDTVVGKENSGVAAQLVSDLKSGVSSEGDTLKKLYDLIVSAYSEVTVPNISSRDLYDVKKLPTSIFVLDDGDGRWALYKATSTGIGAIYVKISDPDLLNSAMSSSQIKTSYESNVNTNAYTDAEKLKLESGVEPKKGVDDFYITNSEKTQGALATGVAAFPTVKDGISRVDRLLVDYVVPLDATSITFDRDKNGVLFSDLRLMAVTMITEFTTGVVAVNKMRVNGVNSNYNNQNTGFADAIPVLTGGTQTSIIDVNVINNKLQYRSNAQSYVVGSPSVVSSNFRGGVNTNVFNGINALVITNFSTVITAGSAIKIYRND